MLNQTKVIFAVGVLLSILVFNLIKSNQTQTWENEFSNLVQKEMILLIGKLEVNMQVLLGVRSLFNSSVHVDREEFKTFVAPILERNSFIQALEWIPRVPDSLRSEFEEGARKEGYPDFGFQELSKEKVLTRANSRLEYFPVYYLEPLEGNQAALGFDLASNEVRKKSLLESRDSGKALATQKIKLVQEKSSQAGALIFVPVYEGGKVPEEKAKRRGLLKGFVLGVYRIGDMLNSMLLPYLEQGMTFAIYEGDRIDEKTKVFGDLLNNPPLKIENILNFSGQKWKIIWQGTDEFSSQNKGLNPILFAGTLLLFTISIVIIYEVNHSRTRVQTILENTMDGIITMNIRSDIQSFNSAAERLFGYKAEEVVGKKFTLLMPEPYKSEHDSYVANYLNTRGGGIIGSSRELIGIRKDGSTFPMHLGITEIKTIRLHLFAGIIRDISDRIRREEKLKEMSYTDGLTGLSNRRHFDTIMPQEWARAKRANEFLSVILMDIDHFKNFNDTYGHLKGDECLQKVSMAIKASMRRPGDFVGRYGGEEFIVVLPGTDSKGACSVADTIRKGIEDLNIENKNSPSGNQVTISLGVATIANYNNASIQDFIDMADKALYQAKDGGRNRVFMAS